MFTCQIRKVGLIRSTISNVNLCRLHSPWNMLQCCSKYHIHNMPSCPIHSMSSQYIYIEKFLKFRTVLRWVKSSTCFFLYIYRLISSKKIQCVYHTTTQRRECCHFFFLNINYYHESLFYFNTVSGTCIQINLCLISCCFI